MNGSRGEACVMQMAGSISQDEFFKGAPPLWPVLVARTPGYFDIVSASLKKQASQYSNAVWTKFSAVPPLSDASPFMQFLKEVHAVSLDVLPV